jgi:Carboxypeptidase regulatory-like domain
LIRLSSLTLRVAAILVLCAGSAAFARTVTGTVNNKTTNKPAAGDTVTLVDVQAGMKEAAKATTDARGRYSLELPGAGPYLIRANHQGGTYFVAAPDDAGPADIVVYDVAAKVEGISIMANVIELETENGQLNVDERYYISNTSSPPKAQFSANTFEFVLPADAVLEGGSATRPGGLPTTLQPLPLAQKGHFSINVPIQPDQGEKQTLFDVRYHLPYGGNFTFTPRSELPVQNEVVLLPNAMTFSPGKGTAYEALHRDPGIQTFVMKDVRAGLAVPFTVSGSGSLPRESQNPAAGGAQGEEAGAPQNGPNGKPGGGLGNPIDTPDPLAKYKWWILGALALVLVVSAAFLLRKPAASAVTAAQGAAPVDVPVTEHAAVTSKSKRELLLEALKEELFSIESEKIAGNLTASEYAEVKSALEVVLRRALQRE